MKRMLVIALVGLAGCMTNPASESTTALCSYVYTGDRETVQAAGMELDKRGVSPDQCAAIYANKQAQGMALLGLGTGVVVANQTRRATFCQPVAGGVTCY